MANSINITLALPSSKTVDRYFSLKLKKELRNELSQYAAPPKLLVISDIEGNFSAFRRLLVKNRVIGNKNEWIFKDGHLVILGDCFDRGEHVTECLWLIYYLEEKAKREGGYVHFILGNHEIMNLNGDWRYIHPKYAKTTKNNQSLTALYDGNAELWRWLRTKNILEKIGNILFVHGGISRELLLLNMSVAEINNLARPFYTQANQTFTDLSLNAIFNYSSSPFWFRGYYQAEIGEDLIHATLMQFGADTIVTGHTVVDKIGCYFNGKVINVDTNHAAGNSEALLIKKNRFYRVGMDGKREILK